MASMASKSKKIVAVGDAGCGKKCLLIVYSMNTAVDTNLSHKLELENEVIDVNVNGQEVTLSLGTITGEKSKRLARFHGYDV